MVVWSGRGILGIVVFIVSMILCLKIFPDAQDDYAFVASFFIAAIFSWFMGKKWNEAQTRVLVDQSTGEEVKVKPNHTLFWINLQYWGFIFGGLGLIILIQTIVKG